MPEMNDIYHGQLAYSNSSPRNVTTFKPPAELRGQIPSQALNSSMPQQQQQQQPSNRNFERQQNPPPQARAASSRDYQAPGTAAYIPPHYYQYEAQPRPLERPTSSVPDYYHHHDQRFSNRSAGYYSLGRTEQSPEPYDRMTQGSTSIRRADSRSGYLAEENNATLEALRAQGGRTPHHVSDTQQAAAYHLSDSKRYNSDVKSPSPVYREKLRKWYRKRFPAVSRSNSDRLEEITRGSEEEEDEDQSMDRTIDEDPTLEGSQGVLSDLDEDYLKTRQSVAVFSILLTAFQLLVLTCQLTMCGIATLEINPMVGPFPDAFSEWGGKNAYLMLEKNEWWRMITPAFLHVGILHLLANAFCQLEAVALFEREWGSVRWLLVYVISTVGCQTFSSFFDPNTIAVGSSGSLMGMYAAKLAQITTITFFDVKKFYIDDTIRLDQLSSVLCGITLVSLLSCFTYIDWSGHMGGLLAGFLAGMVFFGYPIRSCCGWFLWTTFGLAGLAASLGAVLYNFIETTVPNEELGDACEYFRSFFPEDYSCHCPWG